MRAQIAFLMILALMAASCLPPGQDLTSDSSSDNLGEQVSAATPEGTHCHAGTLECADGPETAPCGTWYFDMSESGTVIGGGEITGALPDVPIVLTLSGVIDEGVSEYTVLLSSTAQGSGEMTLRYTGAGLELSGAWHFSNAPEPEGIEVAGGVTGYSCTALP